MPRPSSACWPSPSPWRRWCSRWSMACCSSRCRIPDSGRAVPGARGRVAVAPDPLTTALEQPAGGLVGIEIEAWADAVPRSDADDDGRRRIGSNARRRAITGRAEVDEQFLDTLGVRPMIGGFTAGRLRLAASGRTGTRVMPVLVSYRYWQRELGGDPAVAGRILDEWERNGERWGERVAGRAAAGFRVPRGSGRSRSPRCCCRCAAPSDSSERDTFALVRIPPSSDLASIRERLLAATEAGRPGRAAHTADGRLPFDTVRLVPVAAQLGRHERRAFAMVASGAAVLLLLACINVAGLAAARNVERRRDLAIRRSLGATAGVIVRDVAAGGRGHRGRGRLSSASCSRRRCSNGRCSCCRTRWSC